MRALTLLPACLGALVLATPATAGPSVALVVLPHLDPARYASAGAIGLVVPGAGATVTAAGALAALERGRVTSSLLGGVPHGPVLVRPSRRPQAITFYVALPGPGRHHNVRRYPIAVVGGGFHGILTSPSTRIRGLVSIADVTPAVVALRAGAAPALRWHATRSALAELGSLDERLARAHASRGWANLVLAGLAAGLAASSLLLRAQLLARAALLAIPAALVTALALSGAGITRPAISVAALLAITAAASLAGGLLCRSRRLLAGALLVVFPIELLVLAFSPPTNSLAVIGPHPDGGGRFYGITNQVETLLLVPALLGGTLLGPRRIAPVTMLALLTVGAARTGADGGGGIVLAAGFLFLGLRLYGVRMTALRLAAIGVGAVALMLGFVGLDAATGGSSHVSRAVRHGPAALAGIAFHRLHVATEGVVASTGAFVLFAVGVAGLIWLGTRRPRPVPLEALLVALAVSLAVNDTPTDVVFYGALSALTLWAWCRCSAPGPRSETRSYSPATSRRRKTRYAATSGTAE